MSHLGQLFLAILNKVDNTNVWIVLFLAIVFEVCGTTALKLSNNFTKPLPTLSIFFFYGLGLFLMTLTLRRLDLGLVYAVWSGLGTALVAIIGIIFFNDLLSFTRVSSLIFIIVGVMGLWISSSPQ